MLACRPFNRCDPRRTDVSTSIAQGPCPDLNPVHESLPQNLLSVRSTEYDVSRTQCATKTAPGSGQLLCTYVANRRIVTSRFSRNKASGEPMNSRQANKPVWSSTAGWQGLATMKQHRTSSTAAWAVLSGRPLDPCAPHTRQSTCVGAPGPASVSDGLMILHAGRRVQLAD